MALSPDLPGDPRGGFQATPSRPRFSEVPAGAGPADLDPRAACSMQRGRGMGRGTPDSDPRFCCLLKRPGPSPFLGPATYTGGKGSNQETNQEVKSQDAQVPSSFTGSHSCQPSVCLLACKGVKQSGVGAMPERGRGGEERAREHSEGVKRDGDTARAQNQGRELGSPLWQGSDGEGTLGHSTG